MAREMAQQESSMNRAEECHGSQSIMGGAPMQTAKRIAKCHVGEGAQHGSASCVSLGEALNARAMLPKIALQRLQAQVLS
jgi:hypothetical protein